MHLIFIFSRVLPTLAHVPFVATVTERIVFSNVKIMYPGYRGLLVTTQNFRYDWFPLAVND
jgi:hypothetical protein